MTKITAFVTILLCCFTLTTCLQYSPAVILGNQGLNRSQRQARSSDAVLSHNQWNNVPISEEASNAGGYASSQCEPVTVPICKGMFYQNTRMPNMFNHDTQEEAGLEVSCPL